MLDGKQDDLHEIQCECGFIVGFSTEKTNPKIVCIYCESEFRFFLNEFGSDAYRRNFGHSEDNYIFGGIRTDKSPWRRGLMHSRKQSIRWAFEDTEE